MKTPKLPQPSNEPELTFAEFMFGVGAAPMADNASCQECHDIGLVPVMCCDGRECGCRGMPVDYRKCKCGIDQPTDAQIRKWADTDPKWREREK